MKRQIIGIFFLLPAFFMPDAAADIPVFNRIRLKNERSGKDAEFLRDTVRQIDRLRRLAGKKLPEGSLLVITGCRDFFYDGKVLKLPHDANKWAADPVLRRKITGALAASRFNLPVPADVPEIAPWICAGIENAVMVAATRGKYIAGNRTWPLLTAWESVNGHLPDPVALCRMDFPGGAVTGSFAAEHARMLLEIFARNGRINELFAASLAGEKPDFWLSWYTSPEEARKLIAEDAGKLLWNAFSPLPTGKAEVIIADLQTFFIPEYQLSGKPTGNIISGNISLLAAQLAIPRDDAVSLRKNCAAPWHELADKLSPAENILCEQIAGIILAAENTSELPEKFNTAVKKLLAALKFRQKAEIFFRDTLDRTAPPAVRLALPLNACSNGFLLPGSREERFFLQTLDRYIR